MTFLRTEDPEMIRSIVTHPDIYGMVTDDNAVPREQCKPKPHPDLLYLLCYDTEPADLLGMWMFNPENSICWAVHTYLLPGVGWKRGRQAAKECAAYIWANTKCQRLVTSVPTFNRAARMFALAAGFTKFGLNPGSFLKGQVLYDQTLLGISRPGLG